MYQNRGRDIITAFRIIQYMMEHRWVDSPSMASKLEMNPRKARHWLHAAAEVLPMEVREREAKLEGSGSQHYYRLLH